MKKPSYLNGQQGFSLVEVIVSFVIVGVVAAMMVTFMGTAVQRAGDTALFTQRVCSANSGAQALMLDFSQNYLDEVNGLVDFSRAITNGTYNTGGNTVTSAWIRLNGTALTTQGANSTNDYLRVTVTPQAGSPLTILVSQTIL